MKAAVKRTPGLNRNYNHTLKAILKGAATTVIGRGEDARQCGHQTRLLEGGTKPNLAKPMIARQIASILLAQWRGLRPTETRGGSTKRLTGDESADQVPSSPGRLWWMGSRFEAEVAGPRSKGEGGSGERSSCWGGPRAGARGGGRTGRSRWPGSGG